MTLYGSLDISRDLIGLAYARQMKALLDQVVAVLEAKPLPAEVPPATLRVVKNPFA